MSTEEILAAIIGSYLSMTVLAFGVGVQQAREWEKYPRQRALWARVALWSPLWPLVLIVAGVAFLARTVRQMVRYSRGVQ